MTTPVLIIAFSRHENVVRLIDSLHSQGVERIYLAIDGSKSSDSELQNRIETSSKVLSEELNLELRIWRRIENLGPAVSVITAIDWFFAHENEGVILEDDLILSNDALRFFRKSLDRYSSSSNVFMVSGSNYFGGFEAKENPLATRYPLIWGWATWADRWKGYRSALNEFNDIQVRTKLNEKWFWQTGTRRCLNGIKDAWDIPLAMYQLSTRNLSVLPPVNLISNCGADDFAGNTFIDEWPLSMPVKQLDESSFEKLNTRRVEFDENLISEIDLLLRNRVYGIRWSHTLPSKLSEFLDLWRYPISKRRVSLTKRLNQVKLPT